MPWDSPKCEAREMKGKLQRSREAVTQDAGPQSGECCIPKPRDMC